MRARVRTIANRTLARAGLRPGATVADPYLAEAADRSTPLPPGASDDLRDDHPRLLALREEYAALPWPAVVHSRWRSDLLNAWLDLRWFRGDNSFVWHYRESKRVSELKYFVYLRHVMDREPRPLVAALGEDGAFGCWRYTYPGYPACSRDLLDSVNELTFLDRHLGSLAGGSRRVLDVGAGYGRMAHRMTSATPDVDDYCCVDAVPEATFLSEYYLRYRELGPRARVIPLPDVPDLAPRSFDLALNIHSFSECPVAAIEWWASELARLEVPRLFLVPNEPEGFLSTEQDGSRLDYRRVLEAAGYALVVTEPAITDPAVAELLEITDRHCLFERVT